MTFCIFVARYNENIEWTKTFDTKNVVVYNKGCLDLDINTINDYK